ncbi:hypothetical protein [Arthrobacter sp.]|uniref:hypothetical protein n=1 Tax=Arthrobacter sp. TaxID=1667 RepID=UPI002810E50D|nr:hypothetical protein [Arthrobacter sp.]
MSSAITPGDLNQCASRSYEVQLLAGRVEAGITEVEAVHRRLSQLELASWESPAGRAYRLSVGLQAASLRRAREKLDQAATAVRHHAQNVAESSTRTAAGGY